MINASQDPAIRRAGPEDAAVLAELGARTFSETFGHLYPPQDLADFLETSHGLDRWRTDLANPARAVWLAEADGQAVGYVIAGPCDLPHPEVTASCGEVKSLYVLAGAQASGLGGRLFALALAWLERDGPRAVWLGVWEENFGAQRFYARHGFEPVGEYGFRVGATVDREFIYRRATGA